MSVWQRCGRWLGSIFSGETQPNEVDPTRVEAVIRLIQGAVDEEQRTLQVRRLRVNQLGSERQAELTQQISELLKSPKS